MNAQGIPHENDDVHSAYISCELKYDPSMNVHTYFLYGIGGVRVSGAPSMI